MRESYASSPKRYYPHSPSGPDDLRCAFQLGCDGEEGEEEGQSREALRAEGGQRQTCLFGEGSWRRHRVEACRLGSSRQAACR